MKEGVNLRVKIQLAMSERILAEIIILMAVARGRILTIDSEVMAFWAVAEVRNSAGRLFGWTVGFWQSSWIGRKSYMELLNQLNIKLDLVEPR